MNGTIRKTPLVLGIVLTLVAVILLLLVLFHNELFPEYSPAHRGYDLAIEAGCFSCHGSGGPSSINPIRTGGAAESVPALYSERHSPDELRQWIRNGVSDAQSRSAAYQQGRERRILHMPAYGERLIDPEINDLASFVAVRQYRAEALKTGSRSEGESLARKYACFTCHGELGQGGVENPGSLKGYVPGFFGSDFRALTRNGNRQDIREWILDGHSQFFWGQGFAGFNPGRYFTNRQAIKMPVYRDVIPEEELDTLADFLVDLMDRGPLDLEGLFEFRPAKSHREQPEQGTAPAAPANDAPAPGFSRVAVILQDHCLECHGPEKQKSGYRMDYRDAALKGGDIAFFNGKAAVKPGEPAESLMYEFVTAEKELPLEEIHPMPPDDRPRLSPEEADTIKEWILKGAAWPDGLILGRSK